MADISVAGSIINDNFSDLEECISEEETELDEHNVSENSNLPVL